MPQDLPDPEKQTAPCLPHPSRRHTNKTRLPRIPRQIKSFIKKARAGSAIRRSLKREAGGLLRAKTALATLGLWFFLPGISFANAEIEAHSKTLIASIAQEPRTLNTLTAESVSYTAQVLAHTNEGLLRYDGKRRLTGGVAQRWEVAADQLTFWLREDATWENGAPVTAQDFVFAWQKLVDPATAAPSANLAAPIKHASAILAGKANPQTLGVSALSASILSVELAHPCAWCLKLMTNSIFYPISQTFYEAAGDEFGTRPETHLANGAFKIKAWQRGKRIDLTRNVQYWRQDEVELDAITFDYIGADPRTQLNLFRNDELAVASLDRDTLKAAMNDRLRVKTFPTGHLFHIQFSHAAGMQSANQSLRSAISLVIDKDELVNKVVASPGTRVADSMFHDWLTIGDTPYLTARPPSRHRPDINAAKVHLARARAELNLPARPRLTLTINDSTLYRRVAEYLQARLDTHLNIELLIDPQTTQRMVEKWRAGTSDMTLITWPVDVDDPMDQISFMGDPNFRRIFKGLYAGDDMAALYYQSRSAIHQADRVAQVHKVHEFFTERVTVLPLFEPYGAAIIKPNLKGFIWQPVRGYADFRTVQIMP
jgi:oligopeptide transport system substrate-binding protein